MSPEQQQKRLKKLENYAKNKDIAIIADFADLEDKVTEIDQKLDPIINDKSLQIANPRAVQYAKELKDRMLYDIQTNADGTTIKTSRPPLNASDVQNVIEHWNASLKAYYRNPTYDTAANATIDAMLANKTRQLLDQTIESTQGTGYQALKKQYGALSAIEKDVAKRAQVFARQNAKGLIDFTDIFTGGQVLNGILNLNPQSFVTGLAGKAIQTFIKWKNSPDRAIESIFNEVEQSSSKSTPQSTPLESQVK